MSCSDTAVNASRLDGPESYRVVDGLQLSDANLGVHKMRGAKKLLIVINRNGIDRCWVSVYHQGRVAAAWTQRFFVHPVDQVGRRPDSIKTPALAGEAEGEAVGVGRIYRSQKERRVGGRNG